MYTVVFQVGGMNGKWRRALPVLTREAGEAQVATVQRMGYPAYCKETSFWDTIGLPEGEAPHWDYAMFRPK